MKPNCLQEHRVLQFAAALSGRSHLCELGGEAETLLFTWKMLSSGEGRERLGAMGIHIPYEMRSNFELPRVS